MSSFDTERFFLFTRSYSGKLLAEYIIQHCKKNDIPPDGIARLLARILRFRYKSLKKFILNFSTYEASLTRVPPEFEIFLQVEKEFERIALESLDSNCLTRDDYQKPTLAAALERIVGDTLAEIDDDNEFQSQLDEATQKQRYLYYKVAWRYRLPTMRNVTFLIRMISL
jgi:hypothetical protein